MWESREAAAKGLDDTVKGDSSRDSEMLMGVNSLSTLEAAPPARRRMYDRIII